MARFCSRCETILRFKAQAADTVCPECNTIYSTEEIFKDEKIVTESRDDAFPSTLRLKRSVYQTQKKDDETSATIQESCPKCGNSEMRFTTLQLRSADEGSTVFYTCPRCNHKFSTNN